MAKVNKLEHIVPVRLNEEQLNFLENQGSGTLVDNMRALVSRQRRYRQFCSTNSALSEIEVEIGRLTSEKEALLKERAGLFKKIRAAMQYKPEKPLQNYRKTFRFNDADMEFIGQVEGENDSDKIRHIIDEQMISQMEMEYDPILTQEENQLQHSRKELVKRRNDVKLQVEKLREIKRLEKELLEKYEELCDETGNRFKNHI